MKSRPPVTVIITTFNEAKHIGECLESVLWCDEIMVVDSFSTDETPEIVRSYDGVEFVQRTYYGSASQKNWAMDRAQHDWILILDADERCTLELREEIEKLLEAEPKNDAYTLHRRCFLLGQRIRFSGWQRDSVVRLVRKGTARYPNRRVHADMKTTGPAPRLRHSLIHYMADDFVEYVQRIAKYSLWGASQMWREGRRSGVLEIWGRSAWRFFRTYVLQLGILDGLLGVVFCLLQAYGTYLKWSIVWGWQVNAARGIDPDLPVIDDSEDTWRGLEELDGE